SSSTCQGRRCRNTTSSSVLLQDQSAIECFRPTHDQGFPVWHAGGGPVRDGTNLGDRNATLFDNEGFALCHLAYDLAGLQMELTDRRGLHVTHCNSSLGLPKANAPRRCLPFFATRRRSMPKTKRCGRRRRIGGRRRRNRRRPSISSISPGSPSISARRGRASNSTPRICRSIGGWPTTSSKA